MRSGYNDGFELNELYYDLSCELGADEEHKFAARINEKMRLFKVHLRLMMKTSPVPFSSHFEAMCLRSCA